MSLLILVTGCEDESKYIKYEKQLEQYKLDFEQSILESNVRNARDFEDACGDKSVKWANNRGFENCYAWYHAERGHGGKGGGNPYNWDKPNRPEKPEGYDKWKKEQ